MPEVEAGSEHHRAGIEAELASEGDEKRHDAEDEETKAIFEYVGIYVIFFQYIESKVDQCLLLVWGHENWSQSQRRLAAMTNQRKIDALRHEVHNNANLKIDRSKPNWHENFDGLIERLHGERTVRNSLLHSQFIFDFLPLGLPVMQSDRRRGADDNRFIRNELTKDARAATLKRLTDLLFDAGQMHIQMVHNI